MTKPYSDDRHAPGGRGQGRGELPGRHGGSASALSCVARWARRFRPTGSGAAKPMRGERNSRRKDARDWRLARGARFAAS